MSNMRPMVSSMKHFRALLLVAGTVVILLNIGGLFGHGLIAGAAPANPIVHPFSFGDNFNNGRTDGWNAVDEGRVDAPSHWMVSKDHRLLQSSNIYGGSKSAADLSKPGTQFVGGNPVWRNYDYAVRVRPMDNDAAGVVFRYLDKNNYYRFSMDSERGYQRLVKKVNGVYARLASNSKGYKPGTSYALRVTAIGSSIKVYVNGALVFSVTDNSLTRGLLGLYTWGNKNTYFDNVSASVQADDYFTVVVVPDTQYETQDHPEQMAAQMKWISASRATQNIAIVLHEGDVVDDLSIGAQWANASTYLHYLSGKVPFVVAAGNHDLQDYLNDTRPYPDVPDAFNKLISSFNEYKVDGFYQPGDYRNAYTFFNAGGVQFMVLSLEFGPTDDVLEWANKAAAQYPSKHVMMLTHDYLGQDNRVRGVSPTTERNLPSSYNPSANDGIDIWNKFVRLNANVEFAFNGHVITPTNSGLSYSVGQLVSTNDGGHQVYQTLANYQSLRPAGQGYLRLMKFFPSQHKVTVTTYSPYLRAYLTDDLNQFTYSGVDLGAR